MLEINAWVTIAVVIGMFSMMVSGRSAAGAILSSVVVLLITGVIDEKQAFSGFSNSAPITVCALYVIARAVERTGALQPLVSAAMGKGEGAVGLLRLLVPSAAASAFLNNTPIVAMLIPGVRQISEERSVPPSRVLMPLSFAVILGGAITTIGTSTTLVVSGLLEASGHEPLGIFEVSYVGLPIAVIGVLVLVILAPRVLPDRESPRLHLYDADREFV
ncbi:MAG: SLC13 family permease, partial [Chloroflexi bacterium]|nr:SLC13 family permease [Chloroflexota bacterium]